MTAADSQKRQRFARFFFMLLSIVTILVIYAFAFERTDVSLDEIKDPGRRASLVRIVRGLARPNLIEYDETPTYYLLDYMTPCPQGGFKPPPPDTSVPYLEAVPDLRQPGNRRSVQGHNFPSGATARCRSSSLRDLPAPDSVTADEQGNFDVTVHAPRPCRHGGTAVPLHNDGTNGRWHMHRHRPDDLGEDHRNGDAGAGGHDARHRRIAIPLSFLSARNLMRTIRSAVQQRRPVHRGDSRGSHSRVSRSADGSPPSAISIAHTVPALTGAVLGLAVAGWWLLPRSLFPPRRRTRPHRGRAFAGWGWQRSRSSACSSSSGSPGTSSERSASSSTTDWGPSDSSGTSSG